MSGYLTVLHVRQRTRQFADGLIAVMLVNTVVAAIIHRRAEFGQQRLAGSTPPQVLGMVSVEGVLLSVFRA